MAQPGFSRQIQQDFSGGMFRSGPAELIPANGLFDATNALLRLTGGLFKRGGSSYRATAFGAGLRFIWDGWLANGQTTLVASTTAFGKLSGGAVTSLGGAGMAVAGRPAVYEGKIYLPGGFVYDGTTVTAAAKTSNYYAVVANRLLAAEGSKVLFSKIGTPGTFEATDFHTLPGGVEILGLEGLRSSAAVFTTDGVWVIGGLAKNLTDATGNVQQTLDLYSRELVLWGNGGIASWEGALVVPGTEGVYLLSLGVSSEKAQSFVRISDPIVDLYQEYVRSGYAPGQATVFRNHYFLPIIGGGDVVDLLVCRLDMPLKDGRSRPWTHFAGAGAKVAALTTRVVTGFGRTPELLGALYSASQSRPVTLAYFTPSANTEHDQDGSTPQWSITTRGYTTGGLVPNLVSRLRARYQLAGAVTVVRRNLVPNPSFEYGTTGWEPVGGSTLTASTVQALFGPHSLQDSTTGVTTFAKGAQTNISGQFKAGELYTASVYVKASPGSGGSLVQLGVSFPGTGGTEAKAEVVLSESEWQRLVVTTSAVVAASTMRVRIFKEGAIALVWGIDGVMVEKAATVGSYFDGDQAGFEWAGTPGQSESRTKVAPGARIEAQVATESDVPPQGASVWGGFVWSTTKAGTWSSPGGETFEPMGPGEAPASPDGAKPFSWHPRRKRRFVRFRLSSGSPTSQLALRSLEIFIRPEGRI